MDAYNSPISFEKSTKPFLMIYTHTQNRIEKGHRRKRSANCEPGTNDCCRESLYINFADIGWNDWIILPSGYNAYFCKGSCATAASLTLTGSQHNLLIQVRLRSKNIYIHILKKLLFCRNLCTITRKGNQQLWNWNLVAPQHVISLYKCCLWTIIKLWQRKYWVIWLLNHAVACKCVLLLHRLFSFATKWWRSVERSVKMFY